MEIMMRIAKSESTRELVAFLNSPIHRNGVPFSTGQNCKPLSVWGSAIRTLSCSLQANQFAADFTWIEDSEYFKFSATFQWNTLDLRFFARLTQEGGLLEGQRLFIIHTGDKWCHY